MWLSKVDESWKSLLSGGRSQAVQGLAATHLLLPRRGVERDWGTHNTFPLYIQYNYTISRWCLAPFLTFTSYREMWNIVSMCELVISFRIRLKLENMMLELIYFCVFQRTGPKRPPRRAFHSYDYSVPKKPFIFHPLHWETVEQTAFVLLSLEHSLKRNIRSSDTKINM